MKYKYIVKKINEVIGLTDVPVYFNENDYGSLYFDIGTHIYDIKPDISSSDFDVFNFLKYIKKEHLKYFHVGVPKIIYNKKYLQEVVQELLNLNNINVQLDKISLETYCILHEFGHAHQLYVQYNKNVEKYISDIYKDAINNNKKIESLGICGTKEGLLMHKEVLSEQYADNFAFANLEKVLAVL